MTLRMTDGERLSDFVHKSPEPETVRKTELVLEIVELENALDEARRLLNFALLDVDSENVLYKVIKEFLERTNEN